MQKLTSNGLTLLQNPALNKGTGFSDAERSANKLEGLLPVAVESLETQISRVLGHLDAKPDALEQYIYLQELCDRNETLFYAVLMSDPSRFVPIVYDPTIADACLTYGHIYRRPRGMYLNKGMKGRLAEILSNWPTRDVRFICVSSGGRILGLGDIGVNGAPIPIGKLQLYTACAGVPPDKLLPIQFDIGTSNAALRADSLYTGLREGPLGGDELDELMDEFMEAANSVFPGVCIHFEDWKGIDAIRLLARYREKYLTYNDDIQGTASVALAGLTTALQIKQEKLASQKLMFAGAGSAGIGIANLIVTALQDEGLSEDAARDRIAMFDVKGLVDTSRKDLSPSQKAFAKGLPPTDDLATAVKAFKPTVLIGVSTTPGLFTETVVKAVAANTDRPVIFPLSNPTDKAECTPQQAYDWTAGRALFAAGVQFPDVLLGGKTFHPGQANNFYIFPALALAVYATKPARIDDKMWIAAAKGCADQVDQGARNKGMLFPMQANILDGELTTATRVAEHIFDRDLATVKRPSDVRSWLKEQIFTPHY